MLDIGGGFPGAPDAAITFDEVSGQVNLKEKERILISAS